MKDSFFEQFIDQDIAGVVCKNTGGVECLALYYSSIPGHSFFDARYNSNQHKIKPFRITFDTNEVLLLAEEDGFNKEILLMPGVGEESIYCVGGKLRIYRFLTHPDDPGFICYIYSDDDSYKNAIKEIQIELAKFYFESEFCDDCHNYDCENFDGCA